MLRWKAQAALGLALGVPLFAGCNLLPGTRDRPNLPVLNPAAKAEAPALVNFLNLNARRVQNVRAKVDIDCMADGRAVGLAGAVACQKPRDFRLRGSVLGKPAVDIGSNNDEFWYWISQASPPYVYHCAYRDLQTGKVPVPFPFQPDMVMSALGIAEYDEKAKYELRDDPKQPVLELVQDAISPTGQPVKRITVFNRYMAKEGQPQVVAHVLKDTSGKLICKATVQKVTVDRSSGAVVPTKVKLEWPEQRLSMTLMLSDVQTNALDATMGARLFSRADLAHDSFDLARGVVDTPGGINRAGASVLPRR
jgi:hypothetical protein